MFHWFWIYSSYSGALFLVRKYLESYLQCKQGAKIFEISTLNHFWKWDFWKWGYGQILTWQTASAANITVPDCLLLPLPATPFLQLCQRKGMYENLTVHLRRNQLSKLWVNAIRSQNITKSLSPETCSMRNTSFALLGWAEKVFWFKHPLLKRIEKLALYVINAAYLCTPSFFKKNNQTKKNYPEKLFSSWSLKDR